MENLIEWLNQAYRYENYGDLARAKYCFERLRGWESELQEEDLVRVGKFFYQQGEQEASYRCFYTALQKGATLETSGQLLMQLVEKRVGSLEDLQWLLTIPEIKKKFDMRIRIARVFKERGEAMKGYLQVTDLLVEVEKKVKFEKFLMPSYIQCLLLIIEMEFGFHRIAQARYQLRRLIYLKREWLIHEQEIGYWSIMLDEIAAFVKREDWDSIYSRLTGDVGWIAHFYHLLVHGRLNRSAINELSRIHFEDPYLEKKRGTFLSLLLKAAGDSNWSTLIEEQIKVLPNDLLTALLYGERLRERQDSQMERFWTEELKKHPDRKEVIQCFWQSKATETKDPRILESVKMIFIGGGEKIGGTSISVSIGDHHILLDAGMHIHGNHPIPDYSPLHVEGLGFDDFDALLISHAHLDHIGAVPYVYRQNPQLPIYTSRATKRLMKVMLQDTKDWHSLDLIQDTILSIQEVKMGEEWTIPSKDKEWKVRFIPSGHILGAASIHLELDGVRILFTGDYSMEDQMTVQGMKLPPGLEVDILITESTYGYHPSNRVLSREQTAEQIVSCLQQTLERKGTMLFPAFSIGRSQEIIALLQEIYQHERYLPFPLYLDGRVAEVCRVYEQCYREEGKELSLIGKGIQSAKELYTRKKNGDFTFSHFMDRYIIPEGNAVIASSGMLLARSASADYAEYLLADPRNTIAFSGYLDPASPAAQLLDSTRERGTGRVQLNDNSYDSHAQVESFRFSAHAKRDDIVQLILQLRPQAVFLMHGEHTKAYESVESLVEGKTIYPTVIDLAQAAGEDLTVIPAFNGKIYRLGRGEKA
ncbi:MBL fold metallo-hydrolase [Ammoniphilus sp. CFH 90114]|uniref:MBL fold metallo-hydrolase n=1 Tax=Ammoniphilus sp. CFH 90114 TaxID=2493665 RepID=UPI0013E90FD1|nr:MBL fold metallo-hydrolase [Ammoniphilus sp. CFH 90114]